jgi:hypothetical protein
MGIFWLFMDSAISFILRKTGKSWLSSIATGTFVGIGGMAINLALSDFRPNPFDEHQLGLTIPILVITTPIALIVACVGAAIGRAASK